MTLYVTKVSSRIVALLTGLTGTAEAIHKISPQTIPVIFPHFWLMAALMFAAVYIGIYFLAIRELADLVRVYVPVRKLRNMDPLLQQALRFKEYRDYYGARPEDADIRKRLQHNAAVVTGEPLAGKTRSAIQAVLAECPRAFLLDIYPDLFTEETIRKIVIPSLWLVRPEVVLFLDDLPQYLGKPFQSLFSRLYGQCRLRIVATCRRGADFEQVSPDAKLRDALGQALAQPVELGKLDEKLADEIYKNVWAGKRGPILANKTLPGYLLGFNPKDDYASLRRELRRVLSSLLLARSCGASPCKESLLWNIMEGIFDLKLQDRDAALREMETKGILFVNRKGRENEIEVQHNTYLDEDYVQFYKNADAFVVEVRKLQTLLEQSKQAERVAVLGLYWKQIHELAAAERALNRSIELNARDWRVHLALFGLYTFMNLEEPEARLAQLADNALAKSLALLADRDDKANTLLLAGDELSRVNRREEALKLYDRAAELVETPFLANRISERRADILLLQGEFNSAAPIFRSWRSRAFPQERLPAGIRLIVALTGEQKDAEAAKVFQEFWIEAGDTEARFGLATSLLESAEGCFAAGTQPLLTVGHLVLDRFLPDEATPSPTKLIDLAEFGGRMVIEGFLWLADQANEYLIENAKRYEVPADYVALAIGNLGESCRDRFDFDQAQVIFAMQQRFVMENKQREPFKLPVLAYALFGLGDCELLHKHDPAAAEDYYRQGLSLVKNLDSSAYYATGWASLGLADIYLEKRDYPAAEAAYRKAVIPKSVFLETRLAFGLGRACRMQSLYQEAQIQLLNGWRRCLRHSYTAMRAEFQKEYQTLNTARARIYPTAPTAAE